MHDADDLGSLPHRQAVPRRRGDEPESIQILGVNMGIDPNWVRENPEEAARQLDVLGEMHVDSVRHLWESRGFGGCVEFTEAFDALAAHIERTKEAEAKNYPQEGFCAADWIKSVRNAVNAAPIASLAQRDALQRAEGAIVFVSWLEKECESNGEVGEIFGMTLSGFTGDSRATPNLKAARAVFANAKKLAEWNLGQAEGDETQ